jgi:hypothetical protein
MTTAERIEHLLALQDEARVQRDRLLSERSGILRVADDQGRDDLSGEEDSEFRRITSDIAHLDALIEERDNKIAELAPLADLDVPKVEADADATRRAAAAEIFTGWRNSAPRKRGIVTDDEAPQRRLTVAQARAVASLDA